MKAEAGVEEFLTPREFSEWTGIPIRTLEDWRHRGLGPRFQRMGSLVRYRRDWAREWFAEQQKNPHHNQKIPRR